MTSNPNTTSLHTFQQEHISEHAMQVLRSTTQRNSPSTSSNPVAQNNSQATSNNVSSSAQETSRQYDGSEDYQGPSGTRGVENVPDEDAITPAPPRDPPKDEASATVNEVSQPQADNNTMEYHPPVRDLQSVSEFPEIVHCPLCNHVGETKTTYKCGTLFWTNLLCCCCTTAARAVQDVEHKCSNCGQVLARWYRNNSVEVLAVPKASVDEGAFDSDADRDPPGSPPMPGSSGDGAQDDSADADYGDNLPGPDYASDAQQPGMNAHIGTEQEDERSFATTSSPQSTHAKNDSTGPSYPYHAFPQLTLDTWISDAEDEDELVHGTEGTGGTNVYTGFAKNMKNTLDGIGEQFASRREPDATQGHSSKAAAARFDPPFRQNNPIFE